MNKTSQSFLVGLLTGLAIAILFYLILFWLKPVPLPPPPSSIPEITQPQAPTVPPGDEDISTQSLKKVPGAGLNFTPPVEDTGI